MYKYKNVFTIHYYSLGKYNIILQYTSVEGDAKVMRLIVLFIGFQKLWLCFSVFAYSKYELWQFQNGKLGQSSPKIDQDTRNNTKPQFLKFRGFCYKMKVF